MYTPQWQIVLVVLLTLIIPSGWFAPLVQATNADILCFEGKTDNCITGRFLDYWRQNGGLAVFGYPITPLRSEVNNDLGSTFRTQWFERVRFELHPENRPPYDVLLGRIGVAALQQMDVDWQTLPRDDEPKQGCLWFELERLNVCDQADGSGFKTYWERHGLRDPQLSSSYAQSLALFGLPLTQARIEVNPTDGNVYLTQWFERARFEWHPENPQPYRVLLGHLGAEVLDTVDASNTTCPASITDVPGDVNGSPEPFCFVWRDAFTDEHGFRIILYYLRSGEEFTYVVGPDTTKFIVPQVDRPASGTTPCGRSDFSVTIFAVRPGGDVLVGGFAVDTECVAHAP